MKLGYEVSMPLSDYSIYDAIVDTGDRLLKIQIKSSDKTPQNENHTTVHIPLQNNKRTYTADRVDFFAVWCAFYTGWFIFKNSGQMQSIRVSMVGKNKKYFNNFAFK